MRAGRRGGGRRGAQGPVPAGRGVPAGQYAVPAGQYAVGQVADSLRLRGAGAAPLARLFSAAAAAPPPVLVAVAAVSPHRAGGESLGHEAGGRLSRHLSPRGGGGGTVRSGRCPPVSALGNAGPCSGTGQQEKEACGGGARGPELLCRGGTPRESSESQEEGASRSRERAGEQVSGESALEQADEEEEQKLFQNKVKQKKGASGAVKGSVVNSDPGRRVKQQKEKVAADETVNRRTVFVGNLPVDCTVQALKSLFKEYGPIKSIRFRSLVPAEDTLSKKIAAIKHKVHPNAKFVNAYVVFKEECDAIKALNKNGTEIASGFHIRVDIASKASSHDNKRSVFLGNLSYDISDDAVREHFSVCGDVVAVRVVRDRKTGLGKGFGYVLFENVDAVHLALKLNETVVMGRKIRVKRCGEKWKAPQKRPDQSRAPKDRADNAVRKKRCSSDAFVGEKAVPLKQSTKPKRLKSVPGNKAGRSRQAFGKSQTRKSVHRGYRN
ncbi:LOW QUALITY PROTEIN: RNA-binding protein 34 [Aegotheles albertisi]